MVDRTLFLYQPLVYCSLLIAVNIVVFPKDEVKVMIRLIEVAGRYLHLSTEKPDTKKPETLVNKGSGTLNYKARDGIRTRDPRLGKAILHH